MKTEFRIDQGPQVGAQTGAFPSAIKCMITREEKNSFNCQFIPQTFIVFLLRGSHYAMCQTYKDVDYKILVFKDFQI